MSLFDKIASAILDNWLDTRREHAVNTGDCAVDCWCRAPLGKARESAESVVLAHDDYATDTCDEVQCLWATLDIHNASHAAEQAIVGPLRVYIMGRVVNALASMICNPNAIPARRQYDHAARSTPIYPRWEVSISGHDDDDAPIVSYYLTT